MTYTEVNESISVGAIFSAGKITPRFFVWNRKKYPVKEITYSWHSKAGSVPIFYFAVTSYGSVYEISYNLKTSNWHLEKIYVE